MEGRGELKLESSRIGKRTLGARMSAGVDSQPRKLKISPNATATLTPSAVNSYFQMDIHDVDEHFRRSLQQINKTHHPPTPSQDNVTTTPTSVVSLSNSSPPQLRRLTPSPNMSTTSSGDSPPIMPGQHQVGVSPTSKYSRPPPLILSVPNAAKSDPVKPDVVSIAGTQQLLSNTNTLSQQSVAPGQGIIFPSLLPISAQSGLIPVLDSNGVTQLMIPSTTPSTALPSHQSIPPIVFLGPGSIPILPAAQPSMYLLNPSTDLSTLQQQQQKPLTPSSITTPTALPTTSQQPSYIVFPQTFQMPQTLTLEQLQALNAYRNNNGEQKSDQIVDTKDSNSTRVAKQSPVVGGTTGGASIHPTSRLSISSNHSMDGDEVEEHFARALGDKWHQFKKENSPKIST